MTAVVALTQSLTYETRMDLYTVENAFHLSRMIYVALSMAQKEKLQSLRLSSIECVMSLAQIYNDTLIEDRLLRKRVAGTFILFTPGIISGFSSIVRDDGRCGHKVILMAFRALGRFIALQMENYDNIDVGTANFEPPQSSETPQLNPTASRENIIGNLKSKRIDAAWYRATDEKLCQIFRTISKVTFHYHQQVRLEVAQNLLVLIERCSDTMSNFASKALEAIIKLSEDEDDQIANLCKNGLRQFQENLPAAKQKDLLEGLEEAFFISLMTLPRVFNSFDEAQQLSSLNLLVGYLQLFGSNMPQVLRSVAHSHRLIDSLTHISEFERRDIRLFEEYAVEDIESREYLRAPWKNFRYINGEAVRKKLEVVHQTLAKFDVNDQISYLLLDIFVSSKDRRREVTYILNNMLSGIHDEKVLEHLTLLENVTKLYLEPEYWKLPTEVSYRCQLAQVQYNIIQICLQLEGIGKIAAKLGKQFQHLLLHTLSPILERAGSTNPVIKLAGTAALAEIAKACGYETVTHLIRDNDDYFSFHISNKIRKTDESVATISILTTVLRYSDVSNMISITAVITDVLSQTYDKYFQEDFANVYLHLFQMYIKVLLRWYSIEVEILPIKSKQELTDQYLEFQVSGLQLTHEPKGKTAEEMYREDLNSYRSKKDLKEDEPELSEIVDKTKRPFHIVLIINLLTRILNFLPSKDKSRKLLVLDILIDGLEVLGEWENDLLPLVHKVWEPLIGRFKETDEYLIIHRSYQLLVTLARLSKDFIRSRTTKDVLPDILKILKGLSEHSYLKDHGAAYRYTQAYKLQLTMLQHLGRLVIDIDMVDTHITTVMQTVVCYLSVKQPIPLQKATVGCFCDLMIYDRPLVIQMLQHFLLEETGEHLQEFRKNVEYILQGGAINSNI
ncbi:TELO2-interacting protein 1 homolog isoform X2 [Photinus pyralis]|nr:TELO2-interacting protein 1 homolog isoform X2 [Photinus pyralis]XP_031333618.1 TELO2-interacting protein 1 homolog isoform X2 [Photinus pyralis]